MRLVKQSVTTLNTYHSIALYLPQGHELLRPDSIGARNDVMGLSKNSHGLRLCFPSRASVRRDSRANLTARWQFQVVYDNLSQEVTL